MNQTSDETFVTSNIIGICSVIFILLNLFPNSEFVNVMSRFLVPDAIWIWNGCVWGFITCVFVHVDPLHFLFNMWWAYSFGVMFERKLGRFNYILFILTAAVAASSAQLFFSGQTGIGYSGVVYAMFGFAWMARHIEPDFYEIVHQPIVNLFLIWLVLCFLLTNVGILSIANGAHLFGLIFGVCTGNVFIRKKFEWQSKAGLGLLVVITLMSVIYVPWLPRWDYRNEILMYWQAEEYAKEGNAEAQLLYSDQLRREGLIDASIDWLEKSVQQNYEPAYTPMNNIAWALATDKNDKVRDGEKAVRLAKLVCEKTNWDEPIFLDTLAAAYAEVEQWDKAVETQELAILKLQDSREDRAGYSVRLEKMKKQQKIRE